MTDVDIGFNGISPLYDADGFKWDLTTGRGDVVNGTSGAFFYAGFRWFDYSSFRGGTRFLTDGRELNLGAAQLLSEPTGLLGSRSIYVSDTLGYARFLDTITNTTSTALTYTYNLRSTLGSGFSTQIVATSDGDSLFEVTDTYISTDDRSLSGGDTTVTHILHDGDFGPTSVSLGIYSVDVVYNLNIEPGESVSLLSFGFQNRTASDAASEVTNFQTNQIDYLEGLSVEEMSRILNFDIGLSIPTSGDDFLFGTDGDDTINSRAGSDEVYALGGDDLIDSSGGNDTIVGGEGDDTVTAGTGRDLVVDGAGNDTYDLGGGNDTLQLSDPVFGDDVADGGLGFDMLDLSAHSQRINVDLTGGTVRFVSGASDNVTSFEAVLHSDGAGQINGTSRANSLIARGGDDIVFAGAGDDTVAGDDGNDRLFGEDGADLINSGAGDDRAHGGEGDDTITGDGGNDRLVGAAGDDNLDGGDGDDRLIGQNGDDHLLGGAGADHLIGGAGHDRYEGGLGDDILVDDGPDGQSDTFVFPSGGGNDLVSGYDPGFNILELDSALWGGGLSAQQVVDLFAFESSAGTTIMLDFGSDSILLVNENGLDLSTLANDLVIV